MRGRVLIAVLIAFLVASLGVYFWARTVLTGDAVRAALAAQISDAIGQPVSIGQIGASIFPRIAVTLGEVEIGSPARVQVRELNVATGLRGLISRRIEHATLRIDGARLELPLPPLWAGAESSGDSSAPIEIVSVDQIVLREIEIVSGGRTLRGDIEAELVGTGLTLRRIALRADDLAIDATGEITDLSGPVGRLEVSAGDLNMDALLAFAAAFATGAEAPEPAPTRAAAAPPSTMDLAVSLDADSATLGNLSIAALNARARLIPDAVTLDPLAFELFGGRYVGSVALTLGDGRPAFQWRAKLSDIDVAAASAFAGRPGTMSGTLSGSVDLAGRGADVGTALNSARGTVRLSVADGVVQHLGLLRAVVLATSMREGASPRARDGGSEEPFSLLAATLEVADGTARTEDLRFESTDMSLAAAGRLQLDGTNVNLAGRVQLSEALSAEAGRDLVRYTAEQGRVTLPVTVTGPVDALSVRIDVADAAKRAIRNRATEEAEQAIKKRLGGFVR